MATAALPSVYDAPQIDVFVPAPERQSRVVVFFRPLLVLPHVVVLWLIIAVGLVLTVLGWFAALALTVTSVSPHELLGDGVVGHCPEERDWSLPVTAGARRLVQIFVVLGLGYAGFVGYLGYGHAQQRATLASRNEVVSAYNELAVA